MIVVQLKRYYKRFEAEYDKRQKDRKSKRFVLFYILDRFLDLYKSFARTLLSFENQIDFSEKKCTSTFESRDTHLYTYVY